MLTKINVVIFIFFSALAVAQKSDINFEDKIKSLRQQDNYSEYIYVYLDEFAKNPSVEKLSIFKKITSKLWRKPIHKKEFTTQLYLYINYAFYLKQFGFINQSIIQYEKAYAIYKSNRITKYNIIEFCLKPLANNYTRLGDVDRAEDILKITIEKAQKENNTAQIIAGYSNLAIVYRTKGAYKTAINYLNLALGFSVKKPIKSRLYSDLAINYFFLNEVEKAKENSLLSNKLNIKKNNSISARNAITLGNCFIAQKEFDKALIEFGKALKTAKIAFGKNDREVAKIYNRIAEVYMSQTQFKKALNFYQKSLQTLLPKYNPKTVFENPLTMYFYPENTLKESLDGRANTLIQTNNYKKALKNFDLAFNVEDKLRTSYLSQNSKLIQQHENRNRSESCIDLCFKLYQQTSNNVWLERAFQYAEQSKSLVLLEVKEAAFLKSSFKNDSLFILEKKLAFKSAQLNKSIIIETLKEEKASVALLVNLTKKRNEISNKIQLLKQQIKLKYPQILLQKDSLITVKDVRKKLLKNNELLVEFFDGKNNIYVFSISKSNPISINKIIKTKKVNEQISEFINLFADARGTALQNNVQKYTELGFKLYKNLFNTKLHKNTIIIPDGLFSFIPFDALITKKTTIVNFEKLPYLLHKSVISYAFSASILMHENTIIQNNKNSFIGFFPIFKNNYRNLSELSYTKQEAKSIKNYVNGKFLFNSNASKEAFNKQAKKYSIIHLSTHATAGNYYTPPAIEFYDKTLYLPEIYGYNFQTDLLVLSACETGLGTLRKGEGAMSLARGFSYAGVKNLLVSLWKVNDKSTEKLMAGFYKEYTKTANKAIALHNSKQNYLNDKTISASKKSPYYWASFVYIGETNLIANTNDYLGWVFILVFILFASYLLVKRLVLNS